MKKLHVTVNAETGNFLDPTTLTPITKIDDLPKFYMGETSILCLNFVNAAGSAVSFESSDRFECSIDVDYIHGNDPLMSHSDNTKFNLQTDWSEADKSNGKLSVRIDCDTLEFAQKLGSQEKLSALIEIRQFSNDDSSSIILLDKIITRNVVNYGENAPQGSSSESYYTSAEVNQLFHSKIDREYNFSTASTDASATKTILKTDLNLTSEPRVSLWRTVENGRQNVPDADASFLWNETSLVVTYKENFPDAAWILKY